jgi:hypothetical protein
MNARLVLQYFNPAYVCVSLHMQSSVLVSVVILLHLCRRAMAKPPTSLVRYHKCLAQFNYDDDGVEDWLQFWR